MMPFPQAKATARSARAFASTVDLLLMTIDGAPHIVASLSQSTAVFLRTP